MNKEGDPKKEEQGGQEANSGSKSKKGQNSQGQPGKQKVGWPEWVTFGIGLLVVFGIVGLQVYFHLTGRSGPPKIAVEPLVGQVDASQAGYYLPVEVTNTGGETAEDVQIQLTLQTGAGQPEQVTFLVNFLAPDESSRTVVIFNADPSQGELSYQATFKTP